MTTDDTNLWDVKIYKRISSLPIKLQGTLLSFTNHVAIPQSHGFGKEFGPPPYFNLQFKMKIAFRVQMLLPVGITSVATFVCAFKR